MATRREYQGEGGDETRTSIWFGLYNIQNGRNGGPELALRDMVQDNLDLSVLQKNKLTDGVYILRSDGYSVVAMDAPSRHHGGVAVFYQESPKFAVDAIQKFGPSIVVFKLVTG